MLRYGGKRREIPGDGKGDEYFDFTAVKRGSATVRLLFCPRGLCHSVREAESEAASGPSPAPIPTARSTPGPDPAYFTYTITVR
ncbi:hypothetical protein ACIPRD_22870 [Streptomyces sp. NPDC090108]|uniref:hypothetical protein n=1 Tax=Streptomyces sp. NPDC090108 TaxID=3365947 RepID=UPI0038276B6E